MAKAVTSIDYRSFPTTLLLFHTLEYFPFPDPSEPYPRIFQDLTFHHLNLHWLFFCQPNFYPEQVLSRAIYCSGSIFLLA